LEEAAVMSKPSPKADLLLYIAATDTAVSAVLVEVRMESDTLRQFPIYYVSEALSGSKLFYSETEKMAYAVVMGKRKLRNYFQSHNISVPTAFPFVTCLKTRNRQEEKASGPQSWRSMS
jgi:hypothetical protein